MHSGDPNLRIVDGHESTLVPYKQQDILNKTMVNTSWVINFVTRDSE
jgi:hypothetical protein